VGESGGAPPARADGRRPVIVWQSDTLNSVLQSVLVVPLTTKLDRAHLAGTAMIEASELGPPQDSVALAFQMRAIPKRALETRMRVLTEVETAELEMATDEALGRLDPEGA
jgi:mRNA-degrading endonuclease toxin of MazEF toxin-antitoxin module